jgi:zinc transport system permease protein
MQLALAAGVVVGLTAPAVGFFLVERRMSLVGDAIGHTAFAGVALGYLLLLDPYLTALVAAVTGAASMEWMRSRTRTAGDQALALLLYSGMAGGVVIASAARALNSSLFTFLFGSLLTVTGLELAWMAGLAAVVLAALGLFYRPLLAVALDEEGARASGLPVARLNSGIAVLAAVTITVSMRAVGLLLVASLMVLPVMSASLLAKSVRSTIGLAMAIGAGSVVVGLGIAYQANLAPGGTIVLVCAACFGVARVSWRSAGGQPRKTRRSPAAGLAPA